MITEQQLIDNGYKIIAISRDGGTLHFVNFAINPSLMFTIYGTNPICDHDLLNYIKIKQFSEEGLKSRTIPFITIYYGECNTIEELTKIINNLNLIQQ